MRSEKQSHVAENARHTLSDTCVFPNTLVLFPMFWDPCAMVCSLCVVKYRNCI